MKNPGNSLELQRKVTTKSHQNYRTRSSIPENAARALSFLKPRTLSVTNALKHQERIGFAALDVWQGLDQEFFKRPQQHLFILRWISAWAGCYMRMILCSTTVATLLAHTAWSISKTFIRWLRRCAILRQWPKNTISKRSQTLYESFS